MVNEENPYKVRAYQEGDEAEITEILRKSLPEWSLVKEPIDYWSWKYKSNPNGFECFTISHKDRIIGACHSINMQIKIGKETVSAQCGTDDVIHPDYRGKGLYKKLRAGKDTLETKNAIVNLWSARNPVMINYAISLGRNPVPFKINKMIRIKNIVKHLEGNPSNKPWSYPVLFYMKTISSLKSMKTPKKDDDLNISRIYRFSSDIESFCNKINEFYKLTIVRDQPYLNWRYSNPEADEVIILQATNNNQIVGFCAVEVKKSPKGINEAHILDFLCMPKDLNTPHHLMANLLDILDHKKVNDVHLRVTHQHPYRLVSERCGFIDMTRWATMKYYLRAKDGKEFFKENIDEIESFPEDQVYISHGDIL